MAKVLYISYDGMTDHLGQSQVIPYLKGLSQLNHAFTLISFEKPQQFVLGQKLIHEQLSELNINWVPLQYTAKPPVLSTIKDIRTLLQKAKMLHQSHKYDIVHCRSYISAFAGLMLKRKYGVKFVFDMRGFWPDERVDGKIWNLNNPIYWIIYKYFKLQENRYLRKSDYTISLTENGKEVLFRLGKLSSSKVEVIPCCADFDHFCPKTENPSVAALKKLHGINDQDFIVSYLGSVGTWYMLPEMLDFFTVLLKQRSNAKFLFITGEPPEMIFTEARKRNLPDEVFIIVRATRHDVPDYIALSNVSLFFIKPVFSKRASSPTKLAEIMGMGVPIICNSNVGDIDTIMQQTGTGIVIDKFEKSEYETAVQKIDALMKIPAESIRNEALKRFSLTEGIRRYHRVYESIL